MPSLFDIGNEAWTTETARRLAATKQTHEKSYFLSQTGAVVAATQYVFGLEGVAGTIKMFRARIEESVATGADRTVSIDLQKSTGGGAYATVLSGSPPIQFTNLSALRAWSEATLAAATISQDDVLKITVAVAGAAGSQAAGLIVELDLTPVDPS
jgi:hypothetical protein